MSAVSLPHVEMALLVATQMDHTIASVLKATKELTA